MTEKPIFMTIRQFIEKTGLSRMSYYNERNAGRIKPVKIGRSVKIPIEEFTAWRKRLKMGDER